MASTDPTLAPAPNPKQKPTYYITPLRPSDSPAIADRIAAAFNSDALHHSWVAPVSSPAERTRRLREFRIARLVHDAEHPAPGRFCIVARRAKTDGGAGAAEDEGEDDEGEAVGFAVWEAPADSSSSESASTSASAPASESGAAREEPSSATHPIVLQHVRASIEATLSAMRDRVWGSRASDIWSLSALAVDPACQGQGVGSMLVEWGCTRADEDGKGAYVESSEAALRTYQRAGFVAVSQERDGVDGWMQFEHGGRRCAMVRRAKAT